VNAKKIDQLGYKKAKSKGAIRGLKRVRKKYRIRAAFQEGGG